MNCCSQECYLCWVWSIGVIWKKIKWTAVSCKVINFHIHLIFVDAFMNIPTNQNHPTTRRKVKEYEEWQNINLEIKLLFLIPWKSDPMKLSDSSIFLIYEYIYVIYRKLLWPLTLQPWLVCQHAVIQHHKVCVWRLLVLQSISKGVHLLQEMCKWQSKCHHKTVCVSI